ncbi:hypothetical protein [Dethiobacter alkaliphilus]|uniref:hypothetical protein n=1 Tax=Dethiobacter alkaliphilus TaxID=427926 RepID=UPI0022271D6D|nr:hypothetical protein [Dethiobacter alkaliphilus]MCW3491654.1 hypothetical protein [Dethiobacter alkaliphilus]
MQFKELIKYGAVGLVVIIVLNLMGYNAGILIGGTIEWSTRYILPWIALYWFVQFVKTKTE